MKPRIALASTSTTTGTTSPVPTLTTTVRTAPVQPVLNIPSHGLLIEQYRALQSKNRSTTKQLWFNADIIDTAQWAIYLVGIEVNRFGQNNPWGDAAKEYGRDFCGSFS